ncbi:hypothetical protein KUV80_08460 [Fictibacillus nanhaiensis]|uniref:hypothetical protein n=1 Tax=Fictibacillus nanhaiensis TaxID=742169 RepID=UPI001C9393F4|nr:hypothetical protein [Fictibacillus nanhaiensis]MBY6036682.1 hypothetical protein [Fictibacillus nanhaiensis]
MKYTQKEFNAELMDHIENTELALIDLIESLTNPYKAIFEKKKINVEAEFYKEGNHPFEPGYRSAISVGISDASGELIDIHTVTIWECERSLLGMPISINIPGSRIIGDFLDESMEEIQAELTEFMKDQVEDENEAKP